MRYRRLGRTEQVVSEVGLTARALDGVAPEVAGATLQAAISAGVTLIAMDARDSASDLEPMISAIAGTDRPRLTIVAVLDHLPSPDDLAPEVAAIAGRFGDRGYVDVVAFPQAPGAAHLAALADLRGRGLAFFAGIATSDDGIARAAIEGGHIDVLVAPLNLPRRASMRGALEAAAASDIGVVLAGRVVTGASFNEGRLAEVLQQTATERGVTAAQALVAWGLGEPGVGSVAAGATSPAEATEIARASDCAPLPPRWVEALRGVAG
jgi:aryl-alcohol dehydrogenase-like predicted oxidoreductase